MTRIKHLTAAFLTLLASLTVPAREVTHYMPADGLAGTNVSSICRNEGFLWIATNDGLSRFDGRTFKNYRSGSGKHGLTSNNIETMMSDSQGRLWIGLKTGGVDVYDPRQDTFTHISELAPDYPSRVLCIYEDSYGNIWLGSWEEGLYQLVPGVDGHYDVKRHYPRNIVSSIVEKPAGKLWIGTYYGFFLYDIINRCDISIPGVQLSVTQMKDTGDDCELWFSSWGHGLGRISWDSSYAVSFQTDLRYPGEDIYCFSYDGKDGFSIGTWGDGIKPESPVDAHVPLTFYNDQDGKLWIGTYGQGLYCIEDDPDGVESITDIPAPVSTLCQFGDKVAVGTQGAGLYMLDPDTGRLTSAGRGDETFFQRNILSLLNDPSLLVVSNDDKGINYCTPDKFPAFRQFSVDNEFVKITTMKFSPDGLLWMGTKQNGVYSARYDSADGTLSSLRHYDDFGLDEITGIEYGSNGELWLSSHRGIFCYDPFESSVHWSDLSEMIYCMVHKKDSGELWFGTTEGIKVLNYRRGEQQLTAAPFSRLLPEGTVRDLSLDSKGNLWFSLAGKVYCFSSSRSELIGVGIGSAGQGFFSCSCVLSTRGRGGVTTEKILFGGTDKLLLIDPVLALGGPSGSQILLSDLQVDHRSVSVGDRLYGREILSEAPEYVSSVTIPYQCQWIGLNFTDVGAGRSQYNYEYRIAEFSQDFRYFDIGKPLTLSQLQPGSYHISIRPASVTSDNSGDTFDLEVIIPAPWWRTKLFYWLLAAVIAIALAGVLFYIRAYYRRRQEKYRQELLKQEQEEILHEKESFFTDLSHDIMTPLSLILAPIYDLQRDESVSEDQREKLNIISKNAELLSSFFNSILDFKRAEISASDLHGKDIEIVSYCKLILNAFDYAAGTKGIRLIFNTDLQDMTVSIDTVKFERVLYNLLSNAVKFTDKGGRVELSLHCTVSTEAPATLEIDVRDTGRGIAPENSSRIFEKFYREKRDSGSGGLGIGLYTTRRFVEAMGGSIGIESELGRGTNFHISLPAAIPEQPEEAPVAADGADGGFTVLLVEDNAHLRNYMKQKFSGLFSVAVATNGEEALSYIRTNLPEIVISDVMMPVMDGLELCRRIKSDPVSADIFVILLSARISLEDEASGYKTGADFYLKKPFDPDVLVNHIRNVYATCQQYRKQASRGGVPSSDAPAAPGPGAEFISKAVEVVESHLSDETFRIEQFAQEMGVSRTALHRKFNLLLGDSPSNFVRKIRLDRAAQMLRETDLTVSEIAYTTGFTQAHYFIKCFKDVYNLTPRSWREKNKITG